MGVHWWKRLSTNIMEINHQNGSDKKEAAGTSRMYEVDSSLKTKRRGRKERSRRAYGGQKE